MKIGIITFHDTTNFGSLLQTTGLFAFLNQHYRSVEVINYQCEAIVRKELPMKNINYFNLKDVLKAILIYPPIKRKYKEMERFSNENLNISKNQYFKENIEKANEIYDCFVVGSDILWHENITEYDSTYFLDFADQNKSKISYATSLGLDNEDLTEWQKQMSNKYLSCFNYISVREPNALNELKNITNKKINVVCDPTILIEKKYWLKFIKNIDNKKYVLIYFRDEKNMVFDFARKISKDKGLKVLFINNGKENQNIQNIWPKSIEDFLSLIFNAEYIVTASYHGVIFSLLFNKEFYYFNRNYKGRMENLIEKSGVKNRNLEFIEYNKNLLEEKIDYDLVNRNIDKFRMESQKLLLGFIENEGE